ncbi:hypothetical protein MNBD_ALPHA06-2256 [hydrothermal vent metagenome]|uniref:Outer membrane protein H n=1 Tax=hydrothermal vent metagenome TaxID=652676 RepID=A0A3B0SAY1_9ZZZZ
MNFLRILFFTILIALGSAQAAFAQTKVAVISQDVAMAKSKIGRNIADQIIALGKTIQGELEPEMIPLRSQAQQLSAEASALSPEVLRTRTDLLRRQQDLQQKFGEISNWQQRQMAATSKQAETPLLEAYQNAVNAVIAENKIDVLLEGGSVMFRNKQSDITEAVIAKMDAAIISAIVTRVRVPRVPPANPNPQAQR